LKQFIKNWFLPPKISYKILEYKKFFENNFDRSVFNDLLRDSEKGKRCFIVGTGSSIKEQDMKLLADEIVIGVSGLYNHEDIDTLDPKYYVNPPVFKSHSKYYQEEQFIKYLKDMDQKLLDNVTMFFDISDKKYIEKYDLFHTKKIVWKHYKVWDQSKITQINLDSLPSVWSVSESAIEIALYLGFDEIYLLGFDHDWFNGLFNYAFDTEKARKHLKKSADEVSKEHGIDSEFQMRRHAQIFKKYKELYAFKKNIYNANANLNSYVDTFPKVKYEELFNNELVD
jgi:hypothetical protein